MSMRSLVATSMALVVLCAPAASQTKAAQKPVKQPTPAPKFVSISPAGTKNWKRSTMTVASLAKRVASATAGLKRTTASLSIDVQTPEGQGFYRAPSVVLRVIDEKRYRVDYVVFQQLPFSATLSNDGKQRKVRLDNKIATLPPTAKLPAASAVRGDALVQLFETDFARLAFQGLTEGVDAWSPVLNGMGRGVLGYKTVVEERRMTYQGQNFLSYRVLATRKGAGNKPCTFEIVVDGKKFLPVTIRNVRMDAKGKEWMAQWTASYRFNQTIAAKDLKLGS